LFKRIILFFIVISLFLECAYALAPSAKSAILIDAKSGKVLYEKNAYEKLSMASTTKIMTAICAIENGKVDDVVKVDSKAVGTEGSSMYLGYGESITLKNLLYGLMLSSGNDAAVAIAIHISGDEKSFVKLMNDTAKRIGAINTSFETPNGLDGKNHYTTAYDLALITKYALSNPFFREIVKTDSIKIGNGEKTRYLTNHNKLLRIYEGATGVKTGFTKKSGRCLVSSAKRNDIEVVAVTLNAPNDWNDHKSMLDFAFDNYENANIIKTGDYAISINVDDSDIKSVGLEFLGDISVLKNKNDTLDYIIKYDIPKSIKAPVLFGQHIGTAHVISNGKEIGTVKLVSKNSIDKKQTKNLKDEFTKLIIKYIQGV